MFITFLRMATRRTSPLLAILLAFGFLTCRDNGVGTGGVPFPVLLGTVTAPGGAPLAGVGVHYIFHLTPSAGLAPLNKPLPTTVISFDLPADAVVTMRILRYGSRELIATLVDHQFLAAGTQEVDFDASRLTNGLYIYQLLIEGLPPEEHIMALLKYDVRDLESSEPLTSTDLQGHFSLPYAVLGIGVKLALTLNDPTVLTYYVISDTIDLVLTKPGFQALVIPMTINTSSNQSVSFTMTPSSLAESSR
jgi:hypothetical protein